MSGGFDGAITTSERPPRPVPVELGSAILIVGGITALIGGVGGLLFGPTLPANAGLPPLIVIGLNLVLIATGVLIRQGSHWRICINVVALAIVLYLTAFPNPLAIFYLFLDAIVFYGLMRHRAWFDWKPETPMATTP
jgi:hypothetical protein